MKDKIIDDSAIKLDIITVGGTIDKIYFDAKSDYQIGDPMVKAILDALPLNISFKLQSIMRKDSLEMTNVDREAILNSVLACDSDKILITHGTDTMPETARHLNSVENKTIVLTGALQPARFKNSDAEFNIGVAIGALQSLSHGVYIAMNGQIFNALNVKKDLSIGRFVPQN